MPLVALRPITRENWKECIALRLAPDQERWLPSTLYSIAEAQFYPEAQVRGVYTVDSTIVGFVLFGRDAATGFWKLFRLMIAAEYQQRGYGSAALQAIITEVSTLPDTDRLLVSYQRDNHVARQLYARFGLIEQPRTDDHDTAILWLNQPI